MSDATDLSGAEKRPRKTSARQDVGAADITVMTEGRTLYANVAKNLDRCRLCGARAVPRARQIGDVLLWILVGMLLAYILFDILQDGKLDGSLYRMLLEKRMNASSCPTRVRRTLAARNTYTQYRA